MAEKQEKPVRWTTDMSVDDELIDKQHQRLLDTIEIFVYEEEYMKKYEYPKLEEHKIMHQRFVKWFKDFEGRFYSELQKPTFSFRIMQELLNDGEEFLSSWWINHIMKVDHEYAAYIHQNVHAKKLVKCQYAKSSK